MTNPCKDCGERRVLCHSECQRFAEWKLEQHEKKSAEKMHKMRMAPIGRKGSMQ